MGRIWDPSPETYSHVHPVVFWLGIDLPSWERFKLPAPDVAGTDSTDLIVRRNDKSVLNGRNIERDIFEWVCVGALERRRQWLGRLFESLFGIGLKFYWICATLWHVFIGDRNADYRHPRTDAPTGLCSENPLCGYSIAWLH